MKRACVFLIYHVKGEIDRSVQYYLSELAPFLDRFVIVVNGELTEEGRQILLNFSEEVYQRENVGYDVEGFRFGIQKIGFDQLKEYDELIIANDSVFGPVYPLKNLFESMESREELDFWGVSGRLEDKTKKFKDNPSGYMLAHIQSYFTVFKKSVLNNTCFEKYWTELPIMKNRSQAIGRHETYVTDYFSEKGFKWDVYVPLTDQCRSTDNIIHVNPILCLKAYRCPFIKKNLFSKNIDFDCPRAEIISYLRENCEYDVSMIFESVIQKMTEDSILDDLELMNKAKSMENSYSYRITKPLRSLARFFIKIKSNLAR